MVVHRRGDSDSYPPGYFDELSAVSPRQFFSGMNAIASALAEQNRPIALFSIVSGGIDIGRYVMRSLKEKDVPVANYAVTSNINRGLKTISLIERESSPNEFAPLLFPFYIEDEFRKMEKLWGEKPLVGIIDDFIGRGSTICGSYDYLRHISQYPKDNFHIASMGTLLKFNDVAQSAFVWGSAKEVSIERKVNEFKEAGKIPFDYEQLMKDQIIETGEHRLSNRIKDYIDNEGSGDDNRVLILTIDRDSDPSAHRITRSLRSKPNPIYAEFYPIGFDEEFKRAAAEPDFVDAMKGKRYILPFTVHLSADDVNVSNIFAFLDMLEQNGVVSTDGIDVVPACIYSDAPSDEERIQGLGVDEWDVYKYDIKRVFSSSR